jgi:uncharacterized cupin superfamily protein
MPHGNMAAEFGWEISRMSVTGSISLTADWLDQRRGTMIRKLLLAFGLVALPAFAYGETLLPKKLSQEEIAAAVDARKTVDQSAEGYKDIIINRSADQAFESGVFVSGPARAEVSAPDGYGNDEFMYFISGEATLTSADGSTTTVRAGEGMTVPKGWVGVFETQGYTKLYVAYYGQKAGQ